MWFFNSKKDTDNTNQQASKAKPRNSKRVLVAEDETELRAVLVDKLHEEGFEVLQAVDGNECIEKALIEHPDLILLDLYMPNTSGFEVINRLLGDEWGRTANIIVLTNRGDFTSKKHVYDLKELTYLIKAETGLDELVRQIKSKVGIF